MGKAVLTSLLILALLAAFPTMGSLKGDGFAWNSFSTYAAATSGGEAMAKGDTDSIENAIGFSGKSGASSAEDMAKKLGALLDKGTNIERAKVELLSCKQEDRFPLATVWLTVRNDTGEYQIECLGTVESGKLLLMRFISLSGADSDKSSAAGNMPAWATDLEEVLCTYYAG